MSEPKTYPAGRRWGKSLERLRWEADQLPRRPKPTLDERVQAWDRAMQRAFKGIIPRRLRHRSIAEGQRREAPPSWLVTPPDLNNPKGQPRMPRTRAH